MADQDGPATTPGHAQEVLRPPAKAAIFLTLTVDEGHEDEARDLLADLAGITRAVAFRSPEDGLSCVAGIASDAWDRLFGGPRPLGLHPFRELHGPVHTAPATPGDLLLHLRAARSDLCFELASQLVGRLRGHAQVVDEVHGFRYFDLRDLMGFVDGTENPPDDIASGAVAVGDEDPDFAGGSYVVVQKYVHDLATWDALPVEEQERVIGRHKLSDIELSDEEKPSNSHVALNTIVDENGDELQIVRDNMAFGSIGAAEFGTYFIGYASLPTVIETMLEHMFLGDPPGNHDRILDFSTALTGGLFHVPTVDFLEDPPLPGATTNTTADAAPDPPSDSPGESVTPGDGSLHIGSLRRSTP